MKNLIFLTLSYFLFSGNLLANDDNRYIYYVDLTEVVDDKIKVILKVPELKEKELLFYMPKIIPGTYSIADYGQLVSNFEAFDKNGKKLPVEQKDVNSWLIKKAKKLNVITYWVDDTFDYEFEEEEIFWPAGTNIEEDKNFVLNTAGIFGYFNGKKNLPFEFNILRPENFYGSTGLIKENTNSTLQGAIENDMLQVFRTEQVDTFVANNYDHLVDSPLMYAEADTAVINVSNTEVLIHSYSPNGMITSEEIAATLEDVLMAQNEYLGGELPVDKYAFMFYFTDQPVTSYGALEHSYSSVYYIPESGIERLEQTLRDFAAHEFFHIITPLTIHSEEIHRFDFNEPKMSKHLWLYEGVTEYFAGNVQIQSGLISPQEYMGMIRQKLIISQDYLDTVAFTDISKYTLEEYHDQYYNVYQKGALIGLCLDLQLLTLSNGEMNLRDLIMKLSEKYGKDEAFQDDELFDVIGELSYPEIREFFATYVEGDTPIDYEKFFKLAGINFQEEYPFETMTIGIDNRNLGVDQESGSLFVTQIETLNEIGKELEFLEGDVLVKINDKDLPPLGPELSEYFGELLGSLEDGQELSYTVKRVTDDGEEEIRLATTNRKVTKYEKFVMMPDENATEEQLALRDLWFYGK